MASNAIGNAIKLAARTASFIDKMLTDTRISPQGHPVSDAFEYRVSAKDAREDDLETLYSGFLSMMSAIRSARDGDASTQKPVLSLADDTAATPAPPAAQISTTTTDSPPVTHGFGVAQLVEQGACEDEAPASRRTAKAFGTAVTMSCGSGEERFTPVSGSLSALDVSAADENVSTTPPGSPASSPLFGSSTEVDSISDLSLDEHCSQWKVAAEIIEHDGKVVGYTSSFHEMKMATLREEIEECKAHLQAQNELLVKRDAEVSKAYLDMDNLRDRITLEEAPHHEHNQMDFDQKLARDRRYYSSAEIFDNLLSNARGKYEDQTAGYAEQTRKARQAEQKVRQLEKDSEITPWRIDQMEKMNSKLREQIDAQDKAEAQLGHRINRAEEIIRTLRFAKDDLTKQVEALKSISQQTFSQLLPALMRVQELCYNSLASLDKAGNMDAIQQWADSLDEFIVHSYNTAGAYEAQTQEHDRLVKLADSQRHKLLFLGNKNGDLEQELHQTKVKLDKTELSLTLEEGRTHALEEEKNDELDKLRKTAALVPGLKGLRDVMQVQLFHDWSEAAPAEWRNVIIESAERVAEWRKEATQQTVRAEMNQFKADTWDDMSRKVSSQEQYTDNIFARYANEHNRRVDTVKECNELRRQLGLEETPHVICGDDPENPLLPKLYARNFDYDERYELMLEAKDGKYFIPSQLEAIYAGNDYLWFGELEKDEESGLWKEGEESWGLGDGSANVPVGPSSEVVWPEYPGKAIIVDWYNEGGIEYTI